MLTLYYGNPMLNNDVLRSLRYILKTDDTTLVSIVALGGATVTRAEVSSYMQQEDEPGYTVCPHRVMASFLDGLVVHRRGRKEDAPPAPLPKLVTNNVVLKKLRVAFELKDGDLVAMMAETGCPVSKSELSALFRNPTHTNFRAAGDQFVRNFLRALTTRIRG
jgi:uncharacterized protein YehS (DUF1456 family)